MQLLRLHLTLNQRPKAFAAPLANSAAGAVQIRRAFAQLACAATTTALVRLPRAQRRPANRLFARQPAMVATRPAVKVAAQAARKSVVNQVVKLAVLRVAKLAALLAH